ncbi:arabinose 5-phosphate isomerase [Candidatus Photodesmus katoptron]|uniref:Arabinose 5-phosphate isomerase n=1 Tax=Candidatus Photodesmus katoptron Akat1 TaxID=1236703 RepID=S3DJC3_9GAMM|nr:KpsF/GutQ family sugar-phosphate isomerase [Candidatus Photodesmus katoptron]EPE37244.1 arabinose 5-phosphate isomerase [Candidatus Photodesmus katoptron Akat1]KEY90099.1 arabinose 5-phosphate isomerase [Candidatus Photodesmus katoptron]
MSSTTFDYCKIAKQVLATEIATLKQLENNFDCAFIAACNMIYSNQGKIVVMGIGKSGHIGNKLASTLASTGTPAFFVHPGEAAHGDLGMIDPEDIVLVLSNSGESKEILSLFPVLKHLNIRVISITSKPNSNIAQLSNIHLKTTVHKEACTLGLVPTSSTTATLVMGDALAVALLEARGFTAKDFALSHPGGMLGRKLLLKLSDIMHSNEELPMVTANTLICEALIEITQKGLGMTTITDQKKHLLGIFTDGDLRRIFDKRIDIHHTTIGEVMNKNPISIHPNTLALEGLNLMQKKNINSLILCDKNNLIGALNMHDLLKAGII